MLQRCGDHRNTDLSGYQITMDTNCGTLGPNVGSNPALRQSSITVSNGLGLASRGNMMKLSSRRSARFSLALFAAGCLTGTDGARSCSTRKADKSLSKFAPTYAYEFNDENAPPSQAAFGGF
jgi:hypothetical protein